MCDVCVMGVGTRGVREWPLAWINSREISGCHTKKEIICS